MKLFRYEGYKISISEEALALKPFRQIWNRDKSASKDKAIMELGFCYFMEDPRSDYQYIVDRDERKEAIKTGEGLAANWEPDNLLKSAMELYSSFKTPSALLLEDTRLVVDKFRSKMRDLDFDELEVKDLKDVSAMIKQIPSMITDLDEAERTLAKELTQSDKVRGAGEKSMYEDM